MISPNLSISVPTHVLKDAKAHDLPQSRKAALSRRLHSVHIRRAILGNEQSVDSDKHCRDLTHRFLEPNCLAKSQHEGLSHDREEDSAPSRCASYSGRLRRDECTFTRQARACPIGSKAHA